MKSYATYIKRRRILSGLKRRRLKECCGRLFSFTLIELLVVISIIGLLAALLTPALQSAKEQAQSIQCINNLHQIGIGISLYGEDYGKYPVASRQSQTPCNDHWSFAVSHYLIDGHIASQNALYECNVKLGQ